MSDNPPPKLTAVTVPKWGMAMTEGKLTAWFVEAGLSVAMGQEIAELETSKISNAVEAPADGTIVRLVAEIDDTLPVGGLLAVLADGAAETAEIDAFVAGFAPIADTGAGSSAQAQPETIELAGLRIKYLRTGPEATEKLPILLLHGYLGEIDNWALLRERLPADRAVFALDLPGHGGSSKDVGDGSLGAFAATALAFADAVGIGKAHLVGHSMGGALALHMAAEHPDRVASVVTLAAAGYGTPVDTGFVEGILAAKRARDFKTSAEMLFADPSVVNRDFLENLAKFKRLDGVESSLDKIARAVLFAPETPGIAARLADTATPVLAIFGDRDRVVPAPTAIPARFQTLHLPTGHMIPVEAPVETARAISVFLAERA